MKKGQLLNLIIVVLVSAAISAWSFMSVTADEAVGEEDWDLTGEMVFDQTVNASQVSMATLNSRDAVVLMPDAEAVLTWDEDERHLDVDLSSGGLIYSTVAGDFSLSVNTDFARVDAENSSAYLELDTEKDQLEVFAIDHPSLITFTLEGSDLNSLSVPTDHRIKVPVSKISETIGKLRLTKLTKEFPSFEIDDEDLSDEVEDQFAEIRRTYTENSVDFLTKVQADSDFGPAASGFSAWLNSGLSAFKEFFTVLPYAEERLDDAMKEDILNYAMTNLLYGEEATGETWVENWMAQDLNAEDLRQLYSSLFFVLPGDELYSVKLAAAEVVFEEEEPLASLRRRYQEIESLLDRASQLDAEEAYQDYKDEFEAALDRGDFDQEEWLDDISREYVLLELMLRSNSIFYSVDAVGLLTSLEDKILALAGSDQDLDEERQAFVQSKLRFLSNLFDFVVERKVSVDDATDLANELVFAAESYLNSISAEVAVRGYFESQLEEYDTSIQFMNSPEFYSSSSFEEGLEAYVDKLDDLDELNEYIQALREGEIEEEVTITLEEAVLEVSSDLSRNGVQYSDIVSLEDAAYRLFEIRGAATGGYSFEANYDRETQIFYDVVVDDLRFSTGLTLDSIREVIQESLTEEVEEEEEEREEVEEELEDMSLTESVAISRAEDEFEAVELEGFELTLVDIDANLYTFEGEITNFELPISGTYDLSSNKVSEIVWELNGVPQTLPDVDLSQLEAAITATYQALTR